MKEEFCRPMLDNLTVAVMLIDQNQNIVGINNATEEMLNVSEARLSGHNIHSVLIDDTEQFAALLESAFSESQSYVERERLFRLVGGMQVTIDLMIIPTPVNGDNYVLLEMMMIERPLKIMREELLQKEHQATRAMLRGFAHEIKNPLGGLRGAAQLLEAELDSNELKEYTQIIVAEADRLHGLVDRMLGPNSLPDKQLINVHRVIQHVFDLVDAEGRDNITLHADYDPSIPKIFLDRNMLIQAILNLAKNALKAIGDQPGNITFRTRVLRKFTIDHVQYKLVACISIIDDGPGIPEGIRSQIFFPMVSGEQQGSGLGLAISQLLIDQHGGLIEFDSMPGDTEFRVLLPITEQDQSVGKAAKGSAHAK